MFISQLTHRIDRRHQQRTAKPNDPDDDIADDDDDAEDGEPKPLAPDPNAEEEDGCEVSGGGGGNEPTWPPFR